MGALPNLNPQTIQQLAGIVDTPIWRYTVRYWWVALPIGYAGWAKYQERKRKGEATIANVLTDIAPLVGVVAALVALNATLGQHEQKTPSAPINPASGPVTDASFTQNPPAAQPVALIGA